MAKESLLHLQNGSDIRGVAIEGEEGKRVNLTTEIAYRIGVAFAGMVATRTKKSLPEIMIAVGRDARISGPQLQSAFVQHI